MCCSLFIIFRAKTIVAPSSSSFCSSFSCSCINCAFASAIGSLKNERDKLEKSQIEISNTETNNLQSIAAVYDKMEPESACNILTNMSIIKDGSGGSSFHDAVKILHYMKVGPKAEVLAQLTASEPKLAATFCQRLKQVVEKE